MNVLKSKYIVLKRIGGGNMTHLIHNEDSRVKLPALLHFKRLGYEYQSKKKCKIDSRNNILLMSFLTQSKE
jgi:hypothetical protein